MPEDTEPYQKEKIIVWDWSGVNLHHESQGIEPKITDSIQYHCIERLKAEDYDIIYDDDYSGEIADIITIKKTDEKFSIQLYHLKYAKGGRVSREVENLYEVCGQAQKSIHWRFKECTEFFEHLLKRKTKSRNGKQCSRLAKGSEQDLLGFYSLAKRNELKVEFEIFIVQPSIPKMEATQEQLTLLGVTENYLMEKARVKLAVIGSKNMSN
ncbi:MAG: hypothetical protein IPM55_14925 [Acidobacteria bacterium]|nr:hypothetical protein [Acidobacteriota bacterium]